MGCLARDYAHHKNKKPDVIVSLFFGIFFASFNTNGIWGNIISYLILNQQNPAQVNNCGVYFQPVEQNGTDSAPDVSNVTVNLVRIEFDVKIKLSTDKCRDMHFVEYLSD